MQFLSPLKPNGSKVPLAAGSLHRTAQVFLRRRRRRIPHGPLFRFPHRLQLIAWLCCDGLTLEKVREQCDRQYGFRPALGTLSKLWQWATLQNLNPTTGVGPDIEVERDQLTQSLRIKTAAVDLVFEPADCGSMRILIQPHLRARIRLKQVARLPKSTRAAADPLAVAPQAPIEGAK